ncbi:MAG: hypothetical protein KJO40_08925 [Deltaproteobacteria bacterium]|nr:hypothetical protein [Deltaproteobacteria bacterium]NNK09130.1 hypothetical protein [Myxococcales bacterium]MBT8463393.1 hypothetical protein [Deltaproteobacteria bacterium]MBT8480687.1 hypothetical protein [Deltaproteobacteria bacterium]NNK44432.1 hypothetical protein [Myxococcales bacterium]
MQRSSHWALLLAFGLLLGFGMRADTGRASARSPSVLEQSMGDIQWGWSPKQVYRHLKKEIEASYQEPIAKTTDAIEEDRLRHKMSEETREIRDSYLEFDGTPSAYDSGYLKGEFTQRNGESLLRVRTENTQDFFFFINERLWKRYRAFDSSVFEGASFEEFGAALQQRYGKAKTKSGVRTPGTPSTQWLEWKEPKVLARAVDNNEFYGFYCLILEDRKTVAQLGKLRKNNAEQAEAGGGLVDMVAEQSDEDQNADIADRITGEIRRHDRPEVVEAK